MAQNITLLGASYQAVPAVQLPKTGGGTAKFTDVTDTTATASDVAQGKYFYNASGTRTAGTSSGGGGGGLNVQGYHGMDSSRQTSYIATDVAMTVAVSGTYKVSWMGFRNTTSGSSGSQLYINGSAYGSASTTFTSSYGQSVVLNNVALEAGDELVVRARARGTQYYMYVGNLIIEQTS